MNSTICMNIFGSDCPFYTHSWLVAWNELAKCTTMVNALCNYTIPMNTK